MGPYSCLVDGIDGNRVIFVDDIRLDGNRDITVDSSVFTCYRLGVVGRWVTTLCFSGSSRMCDSALHYSNYGLCRLGSSRICGSVLQYSNYGRLREICWPMSRCIRVDVGSLFVVYVSCLCTFRICGWLWVFGCPSSPGNLVAVGLAVVVYVAWICVTLIAVGSG